MTDGSYDVLVVGGGIVGACVARDGARRGLRVALVDRGDFGSGISWNSLKTVHGGLRSLQKLDVRQARAFVRERRAWLRIAPHLVEPISFAVPTRGAGVESALVMRTALALNDFVSGDRNEGIQPSRRIPPGRLLTQSELRALVPGLFDSYTGAALFSDAQLYSAERLVRSVLADAERSGATAVSHAGVVAPLHAGGVLAGAVVEDQLTGERGDVRAAMIVNAAGAAASRVAEMLTGRTDAASPMTGIALNLMLAGDNLTAGFTLLVKGDGLARRLFAVPWRGRTLVGTAHYECVRAPQSNTELEPYVERFVREVAQAWPSRGLTRDDVLLVHSGMQPSPKESLQHGPPKHEIVDHASVGVPQLLTAIGPKLTMSRAIAEQLVSTVIDRLGRPPVRADSATAPLDSAPEVDIPEAIARAQSQNSGTLPHDVVTHLVRWYGNDPALDRILEWVRADPALGARVHAESPVTRAQLRYAAEYERALTVDDLLMGRTELGATARVTPDVRAAAQLALDIALAAARESGAAQPPSADSLSAARGSRSL